MASQGLSANDVKTSFFEVQKQSDGKDVITYNVKEQLKHQPFRDYLSGLSPVYLQDSVLIFKDSDRALILDLEQIIADIHVGLKANDYHGRFISIGSSKGQLKIQSLNELDLAFLLDRDILYVSKISARSRVDHVKKGQGTVDAREFRDKFGETLQQIISNIKLPPRLAHSGYHAPDFSGIRYNGPATTILLTWDPEGEKREISVDITPMLHIPAEDEKSMKQKITEKHKQIQYEMPREIFRFKGTYHFPNPISNQWELSTACYEATNLLPHLQHNTPFKRCIVMCKSIASLLSSIPTSAPEAQETSIMKQIVGSLVEPNKETLEVMKYGHTFLSPSIGDIHKEMTKKAVSINTAAITHIALDLASGMQGAFTSTHDPDERQRITMQLVTDIFRYLSSGKHDVQHFFLDSKISLLSVATWARQIYDIQQLVNNIKTQCLLTAHLLTHWNIEELHQDVNQHVEEVPDWNLQYIEDTFLVRAHFNGEGCNQTFGVILKLVNALGNTMGGIIQVTDPDSTDIYKQKIWESAFKEYATHCSVKEHIQFLGEHDADPPVVYVPKYSRGKSLTSYKIHFPDAREPGEGTKDIVAYLKQQTRRLYYISENRRINSTVTHVDQSSYTSLRELNNEATFRETESKVTSQDECLNTKQTPTKHVAHTSENLTGVTLFDQDVVRIDSVSAEEANRKLQRHNKLQWTRNKHSWEKNLRHINIDVDSSAKELIDSEKTTLKLTSPGTFIPTKESILHRHPRLNILLESIENRFDSKDVLIIACDSWPRIVDIGIVQPAPIHHVLDVVVFDRAGTVAIWCVFDNIDDANLSCDWQYAVQMGKSTKSSFHHIGQDIQVQCNVYSSSENIHHWSSKELSQHHDVGKRVMHVLACLLIRKKSHHRNCLGEDIGVYLTAKQMEVILQSAYTPIVLIEGPPGSGKTSMAFHICSKYSPPQVLYICTTTAFQNYLHFQQNCRPELVQNEADMKRLRKTANLENCKCIIIDDGHQLPYSYSTWEKFLLMAMQKSCQVYIFADNQYQNFNALDSGPMNECIEEMMITNHASKHHLYDIHRNSRRVSSFLVASTSDTKTNERCGHTIGCSSVHEGHDVEVQHISNILEESEKNELLKLIQSQLSPEPVPGQHNMYTTRDIAILVDTKHAREDVDSLSEIFEKFTPFPVHSAGCFPVDGITLDTLDNFVGFDRKVCICVVRRAMKTKWNKQKSELAHQLQNPKYRTFVASRGVSRVIFIVYDPINVETARVMKMDLLPYVPRVWTKEESIASFSWMSAAGRPALFRSTQSGEIHLVHVSESEEQKLPLGMVGMRQPCFVDCTPDGSAVLMVGREKPCSWIVYKREKGIFYHGQATYQLQDQSSRRDIVPIAARWTPDGDVVMGVEQMSTYNLRKCRVLDGDLLWEVKDVVRFVSPGNLSVCQQSGHILLNDWWEVHVYSPVGKRLHLVRIPDRLPTIWSVCAVRKHTWLSGHGDGSVRLWGVHDTARAEHVLISTGKGKKRPTVGGLSLSRDGLLAVRTYNKKLIVYNVNGFL